MYTQDMATIEELETRINKLEERNKRVELHKDWETSYTKKILLVIFTYLSIALYFQFVLKVDPWLNAIVPSLGFLLSTLTLSLFKDLWVKYIYKK